MTLSCDHFSISQVVDAELCHFIPRQLWPWPSSRCNHSHILHSTFTRRNPLFSLYFYFWRVVPDLCFIRGYIMSQKLTWIALWTCPNTASKKCVNQVLVNWEQHAIHLHFITFDLVHKMKWNKSLNYMPVAFSYPNVHEGY